MEIEDLDPLAITPMPKVCTMFKCGGRVRRRRTGTLYGFHTCDKCGVSYGN